MPGQYKEIVCAQCGKTVFVGAKDRKGICRECLGKPPLKARVCANPECSRVFTPKVNSRQIYCCPRCRERRRQIYWRDKRREMAAKERGDAA